jgi:hypothetical protein
MVKRILILLAATFALAAGTAAAGDGAKVKGPFSGAVHAAGSITYKDASAKSWTWDRGTITALSSTSLTLTRRDKVQVTFTIGSDTVVRNAGASYTLADLKQGLNAAVISQGGHAVIVRNLRGEGAPSGADQSAIDGPAKGSVTGTIAALYRDGTSQSFQYDRGQITEKTASTMTIKRLDGKSVSFTYDPALLVRERGEVEGADALSVGERAMFFSQAGKLVLVRCVSKAPKS